MRVTSDTHLNPGDIFNIDADTLNGDGINLLPIGLKAWETPAGSKTIESIASRIDYYIMGNHEGRKSWIKKLFKPYPHVKIVDHLDYNGYRIMHGHQFTDWRIWSIGADDVVNFMTGWNSWLRRKWYAYCVAHHWMPSQGSKSRVVGAKDNTPVTEYDFWVDKYWNMAQDYAGRHKTNLIIGHSHKYNERYEMGVKVIDLGDRNVIEIG